jgi:hypothetical protein
LRRLPALVTVLLLLASSLLFVPLVQPAHATTALDGHASNTVSSSTTTTCAATLTTLSSPDVLIALGMVSATSLPITGVSGDSLTWHEVPGFPYAGTSAEDDAWYAVATGTVSGSITLTRTAGSAANGWECDVFGVSGVQTSGNIFDPNAGLPSVGSGTASAPKVTTVSTTYSTDFVVAFVTLPNAAVVETAGTLNSVSMAMVDDPQNSHSSGASEYYVSSSAYSSVTATFAVSSGSGNGWSMAAFALVQVGAGVTQPILITVPTLGPASTFSISGCGVSNSTLSADDYLHTYTGLVQSCSVTVTVSSDGASSRYRFVPISTTLTFSTCASGTCAKESANAYNQLKNSYEITAKAQSTFDASLSFVLLGTFLGTSGSTIATLSPNSNATDTAVAWADYGMPVVYPANPTGAPLNTRWQESGTSSVTYANGGNTFDVNYYKQLLEGFTLSPYYPTAWDGEYTMAVIGYYLGTPGTPICLANTSNGTGSASCEGYLDYDTLVSVPNLAGAWIAAPPYSFTPTAGGNGYVIYFIEASGIVTQTVSATVTATQVSTVNSGATVTQTVTGSSATSVSPAPAPPRITPEATVVLLAGLVGAVVYATRRRPPKKPAKKTEKRYEDEDPKKVRKDGRRGMD